MKNKNKSPLVSVIMPAYNAEKYLAEAIESILRQTYRNFEFIIIDDNSIDQTREIINQYSRIDPRIIFTFNKENLKLSHTLNKGIKLAKGKYIVRMDADDVSFPDRIEKQVKLMENMPEAGVSGGTMMTISPEGIITGIRTYQQTDNDIRKKIFKYNPFGHPTVIIRSSIMEKSGPYNPLFNPIEDYELYFRLGKYSKFANLTDKLIKYRIVSTSMTSRQIKEMEQKSIQMRKMYYQDYNASIYDKLYVNFHYMTVIFPFIPTRIKLLFFYKVRKFL